MKLFFSFMLIAFVFNHAQASKIIISYENGNKENALIVKSIFINTYSIPEELISINDGQCTDGDFHDTRFLNLCINKKGDLIKISQDIKFKINSLLSFR